MRIAASAERAIMAFARESEDGRETGGILVGRGPGADGVVHVEVAGDAGPRAIRRSDFFLRDLAHARQLADDAWERTGAVWVGEWHTHLKREPQPSQADLSTYVRLLAIAELNFVVFTSLIVIPDVERGWAAPQIWPWLLELNRRNEPGQP